MAQTQDGKKKAVATLKAKYGNDYFSKIGALGAKAEHTKPRGFAALSKEKLKEISQKGHESQAKKKHLGNLETLL